jgi:hypothetical protein
MHSTILIIPTATWLLLVLAVAFGILRVVVFRRKYRKKHIKNLKIRIKKLKE